MFFKHLNGGDPSSYLAKTWKWLRRWRNSKFRRGSWPLKCFHPSDRSDSFERQNKMATHTLPQQQAKVTEFVGFLPASPTVQHRTPQQPHDQTNHHFDS